MKINDNEYTFENASFSKRSSWGHTSKLFKNGFLISSAKTIYYNRTWESYQYQSVMKSAVYNLIDENKVDAVKWYKALHSVKRISAEIRAEIQDNEPANIELLELLSKI